MIVFAKHTSARKGVIFCTEQKHAKRISFRVFFRRDRHPRSIEIQLRVAFTPSVSKSECPVLCCTNHKNEEDGNVFLFLSYTTHADRS